jgi:large subunit ribosomal protein L9
LGELCSSVKKFLENERFGTMKVVLKEEIENLGKIGDVVEVKSGYARNFLIPNNLALEANAANLRALEYEKRMKATVKEKEKKKAVASAKKLEVISCTVKVKTGDDDRIFGSVTHSDIQKALENQGINVDKRNITFEENIKTVGIYHALIKLHPEVETKVKVWVVKE